MSILSMFIHPCVVREAAAKHTEMAAVSLNGINGVLFMAGLFVPMLSLFTPSLVLFLAVLFGPLAGFIVSSLYCRIEWAVGQRLGGKASLDEQYRLFAWSLFPTGIAVLLYGLMLLPFTSPSIATEFVVAIPSMTIFCCAIRNYCSNVIAAQQFSRRRGIASAVLTLVLFLVLIGGGIGYLWLFCEYGVGDGLKSFFAQ